LLENFYKQNLRLLSKHIFCRKKGRQKDYAFYYVPAPPPAKYFPKNIFIFAKRSAAKAKQLGTRQGGPPEGLKANA